MRSTAILILAISVGIAPAPAAAQARRHDARSGDPLELLLSIGEALELTGTQATRIREIQRDLEERNRPLVERLVEIRRQIQEQQAASRVPGGGSRPSPTHLEIARPPMRQIHINNRRAMEEVGALLTADQKARAAELLELEAFD